MSDEPGNDGGGHGDGGAPDRDEGADGGDDPADGEVPDGRDTTAGRGDVGGDRGAPGADDPSRRAGGRRGEGPGRQGEGDDRRGAGAGRQAPGTDDSPLGDLARELEDRRTDDGDDLFERAFDQVDVESVDAGDVWSTLEDDHIEATVESPRTDAEREVFVIPKRDYCQRCQYFSDPPEVACTYEGSEIVALEDVEHFRVTDCPVVRGEEELRDIRR